MIALSRKLDVASDNDSKHSTLPYIRNKAIKWLWESSVNVSLLISVPLLATTKDMKLEKY